MQGTIEIDTHFLNLYYSLFQPEIQFGKLFHRVPRIELALLQPIYSLKSIITCLSMRSCRQPSTPRDHYFGSSQKHSGLKEFFFLANHIFHYEYYILFWVIHSHTYLIEIRFVHFKIVVIIPIILFFCKQYIFLKITNKPLLGM